MDTTSTADRLNMPLGEAIFTLRAIRRLKPDPIPDEDLRDDVLEGQPLERRQGTPRPLRFLVHTLPCHAAGSRAPRLSRRCFSPNAWFSSVKLATHASGVSIR